MKRIDWRKKFVRVSLFFLRVFILILRIYVTCIGFISVIGGLLGVWGGNLLYLGNLILGGIFIFPFRRLRESYLMIYFWLLAINSLLFVWQSATRGPTTPWYMAWIDNLAIWANVVVVWQYVRSQLRTSEFKPFFHGKRLLQLFGGLTVLTIAIFVYMFFDPHVTKDGMRYLRMGIVGSGESKWVEPYYHADVFGSGYKVESSVTVNQKSPLNLAISLPLVDDEPIEIYENDKQILTIKHNESGVQTVVAYDEKSPHGLVGKGGLQPWRRDTAGNFHPETIIHKTELLSDYDLWIEFAYDDPSKDKWSDGRATAYKEGVGLEIDIRKYIEYPSVPKLKVLPFYRQKLPWTVMIKQGDKEVNVVDGIELWYR